MLDNQNNTIMVEIKDVYGQPKVYPVCMEAKIFAEIAGTTTLLPRDIQRIQMLGYEVKVKPRELKMGVNNVS
jgi:hypothetical protein